MQMSGTMPGTVPVQTPILKLIYQEELEVDASIPELHQLLPEQPQCLHIHLQILIMKNLM